MSLDSSLKRNFKLPESINIEEYISIKSLNVDDTTKKIKLKQYNQNGYNSKFINAPSYSIGKENKKNNNV